MTFNKHGLSRTIPDKIKYEVRKNDGYGCVICGSLIVQYEHIEPEFCNAYEHKADCITLLCPTHHDQVTKKQISKKDVKKYKNSPYCYKHGFGKMQIYPNIENLTIKIGRSIFRRSIIALVIRKKPLIWFEVESNNILLNAVFYNANNEKIGYIKKNEFIGLSKNYDIKIKGSEITINSAQNKISLKININAEKVITIERLNMCYNDGSIQLNTDGSLTIYDFLKKFEVGRLDVADCNIAVAIGEIITSQDSIFSHFDGTNLKWWNTISKCIYLSNCIPIFDINFTKLGFIKGSHIYNHDGFIVAFIANNSVYTLNNEYVGNLYKTNNGFQIGTFKDTYHDGEPIYISNNNKIFNFLGNPFIDLSYRFFDDP